LVDACDELARKGIPFQCRIVGMFSPGFESPIRKRVALAGLEQKVTLTGAVDQANLLEHYGWANVVVLPSREESSPLSLIQGMASGRCVFGANAAGIPILLDRGQLGTLFELDHPSSLARRLADLHAHPESYRSLSTTARLHAQNCFKPRAVALQTLDVYRKILERQPPPLSAKSGNSKASTVGP
jgi:glycosyltransferase involved in cell wall biosynthesis